MFTTIEHIEIKDNKPVIKGRNNLKVRMVAEMYLADGVTIEEVMEQYDLTPAQIYAAVACYYDNIEEFKRQEAEIEPLIEKAKQYTEELKARWAARLAEIEAAKGEQPE